MKRIAITTFTLLFVTTISLAQEGEATPQLATPIVVEPADTTYAFWFNSEFLLWWIRNNPLPTPLTSAALPPFNSSNAGAVGDPQTHILIGEERIDTALRAGGRFTLGFFLDRDGAVAFEGNYFFLGRQTQHKAVSSDGSPNAAVIGVTLNDVSGLIPAGSPTEIFLPLAAPGLASGSSRLSITNFLQGAEANALFNWRRDTNVTTNVIVGFRYLQLDENLSLTNSLTGLDFLKGLSLNFDDNFDTRNRFYGGQLGLATQLRRGRWFCDATGKLALGSMNQSIDVFGRSSMSVPGLALRSADGGLYALASNSGEHSRNMVAFVPELTLNLGINVTSRVSAFVGYNLIYVSNVLRPGDQIDHSLNLTQSNLLGGGSLVGPARPATLFSGSDFWTQGINLGFQVRY